MQGSGWGPVVLVVGILVGAGCTAGSGQQEESPGRLFPNVVGAVRET